jgi:hypothetical protein
MNQETRNQHIQHARAELRAGRPVTATWPTPGTRGQHVTRVALTEIHHFAQYMVPLDAVVFEWPEPEPAVEVVVVETAVEPARRLVDVAAEWLERALVPDGLPSVEAAQRAVAAGITLSTLKRACKALGVRKVKNGRAEWWWKLPEEEGE